MTPEAQQIAIAEACGWLPFTNHGVPAGKFYRHPDTDDVHHIADLPDYLNDLNAMHEAEKKFTTTIEKTAYMENLLFTMNEDPAGDGSWHEQWDVCHATAAQRAEAFLRTIGKWQDSP